MFSISKSTVLPALGLLVLLPSCEAAGMATRETFAACAAQTGLGANYTVDPVEVEGGPGNSSLAIMFVPDANTTQAQADEANRCVERRLSEASGRTLTFATPVNRQPAQSPAVAADQPAAPSEVVGGAQCNLQMVGGAGYACR